MKFLFLFFSLSFLLSAQIFTLPFQTPTVNICTDNFNDLHLEQLDQATEIWQSLIAIQFKIDGPGKCHYLMDFVNNRFLDDDTIAETWLDTTGKTPVWITWYSRLWVDSHPSYRFLPIMIHEIGHMLGLDDLTNIKNQKDVMFSTDADGHIKRYIISSYDLRHIKNFNVKTYKPYVIK